MRLEFNEVKKSESPDSSRCFVPKIFSKCFSEAEYNSTVLLKESEKDLEKNWLQMLIGIIFEAAYDDRELITWK